MGLIGVNFSIHREGFLFVGGAAVLTLVLAIFSSGLALVGLIITLYLAYFFRNPKRAIPAGSNLIVSPADGTVCSVVTEVPPAELRLGEEQRYRVSIFLSLFNVHVNRIPVAGKVKSVAYHPGSFVNASLDKASVMNERNTVVIEMDGNAEKTMAFVQIAGMIGRRIVCDVHEGQEVGKGEICGMIRFGSRCDVWLPVGSAPQVFVGQTTIAGETVLADTVAQGDTARSGDII
ncbi:MAG: phosphatidylserine decarboxylase [Holosporales bacterium]|jgi:phosphatidylserine decarboxylase|nr:phosphatidylserine decarboxylase [Holosporales bacterium]